VSSYQIPSTKVQCLIYETPQGHAGLSSAARPQLEQAPIIGALKIVGILQNCSQLGYGQPE